jgi:divalent metal cation (Fe/Co/Zn/Cd) transporter
MIPLGTSFFRLLQQQQIETEINQILINETITVGRDVENVRVRVRWTSERPIISVILRTDKDISPNQVRLVEELLNQRLNRNFEMIFSVIPIRNITGKDQQNPVLEFPLDGDNFTLPENEGFKFFQNN